MEKISFPFTRKKHEKFIDKFSTPIVRVKNEMPAKIMIFNQEVSASKQPGNNHAAASAKRIAKDSHWRRKIADESDGFR